MNQLIIVMTCKGRKFQLNRNYAVVACVVNSFLVCIVFSHVIDMFNLLQHYKFVASIDLKLAAQSD